MFFDSMDSLSAFEENVGSNSDYEIWMNEPRGIQRRKQDFLSRMLLGEFEDFGDESVRLERVTEYSGAVSLRGSVDECDVSVGRETEAEPLSQDEDLDLHDSTTCCSEKEEVITMESLCNVVSSVKASQKATKRMSRWWSNLRKKSCKKKAVDPALQTLNMNEMKVCQNKKKCAEFSSFYVGQEIKAHEGFILTMKFSPDGQYLASGGQDGVVRIWQVSSIDSVPDCDDPPKTKLSNIAAPEKIFYIDELPFQELHGHSCNILNLAWSKANRLLSSSKDKTVRLWEVGSNDCLNVYYHNDYVTCIQFNPVDDTHFISGSIDGKVRIWNVSNGRVVDWLYAKDVITALSYKPDGQGFVIGSVSGVCRFYVVDAAKEHIQLEAQVHIHGRKKTSHNKITGIEFSRKEDERMVITSEDSKVSILDGIYTTHKYKGLRNSGSQMSASFTSTEKHIISVGEDSRVYVWNYNSHPHPNPNPTSSNSNHRRKSIHSCEHFFLEGVSVALPWLGSMAHNEHHRESRPLQRQRADAFSLCSQWCNGRAATWPEEQLQHSGIENEKGKKGLEGWNVVIVTGSLDGRIRTFQNFEREAYTGEVQNPVG